MESIDTVAAYALEIDDLVNIEGDLVTIKDIEETEDNDEVVVIGASHDTGDTVRYELYAFDTYSLFGA